MPEKSYIRTDQPVTGETVEKPESPPVHISHGSGSLTGLAAIAAVMVPLVIDALTDERLDPVTRKWLMICGTILIVAYMAQRAWQSVVAEKNRGKSL